MVLRRPFLLLLLCVAGAVLPLPGEPAGCAARDLDPVEAYMKLRRDRDPKVRLEAVKQLVEARGAEAIRALLIALEDSDPKVGAEAQELLCAGRDRTDEVEALATQGLAHRQAAVRLAVVRALGAVAGKAVPQLVGALDHDDPAVRREAAAALGAAGEDLASPALHARLADDDALVRAEACAAIGALRGAEAVGAAVAVLRGDRAGEPRIAAAKVLGAHPCAQALEHLSLLAADRSWSLRVAVAQALAEHRVEATMARGAAKALVRALERESRLRVRWAQAEALLDLTGIDFGPDPARWVAWFAEAGATFEPPSRPRRKAAPTQGSTRGGLLELPIDSDHVAFVLDASSSMNDPRTPGAHKTKREALLEAFEGAVNRLPEGSRMNVIPFATEPRPFKPSLFDADRAARRAAVRYLERTRADGRTNIHDALELALADPDADTVVLLTDGAPSEGRHTARRAILASLEVMNRYRLARVHTVEVGSLSTSPRWRGFMLQIAQSTGGHHVAR